MNEENDKRARRAVSERRERHEHRTVLLSLRSFCPYRCNAPLPLILAPSVVSGSVPLHPRLPSVARNEWKERTA